MSQGKIVGCNVLSTESDDALSSPAIAVLSGVQVWPRHRAAKCRVRDNSRDEKVQCVETTQTMLLKRCDADERLDLLGGCLRVEFEQRAQWPGGDGDNAIGLGLLVRCRKGFSDDAKRVACRICCVRNCGQSLAAVPGMANPAGHGEGLLGVLSK